MRLVLLAALLCALLVPATAAAQSNPFGPLPQAPPPETPTPEPANRPGEDSVSRGTMFLIGGGVILAFIIGGVMLTRDARRSLTPEDRDALDRMPKDPLAEKERKKLTEAQRRKQRQKARAARAARKRTKRGR